MATYITYICADNSPATVAAGSFITTGPASVLQMTDSLIQFTDTSGGYVEYYGSFNYTYSGIYQYLSWPGSTITGITTYDLNWTIQDTIYGSNISGSTWESYALNNDVAGLVACFFSGDDWIAGSNYNDVLWGYLGNDTIIGGTGADTLVGGVGDDTYTVDGVSDVVIENINEGIDTIQSWGSYTLDANVENLILLSSAQMDGTGNALDNCLTGNDGTNVLSGGDGADTLIGGAGSDTLDGGLGADTLTGGSGDNVYIVDNAGDVITPELQYGGGDTVKSSVDFVLADFIENLTLTGTAAISGTGNALNNVLTGNDGANVLNGGDGNDTLFGGAGNDVLIGGLGVDSFFGGTGDDTYVVDAIPPATMLTIIGEQGNYVSGGVNTTFTSDVQPWQVYADRYNAPNGIAQVQIYGNDFSLSVGTGWRGVDFTPGTYSISDLNFSFGMQGRGNTEIGSVEIQSLVADLSGASAVLQSLSMTFSVHTYGYDPALHGMLRYNVPLGSLGEQVTELANEGTDHVISSVSYALGDNVENLTLSGTAAIDGAGNTLDNVLTGNSGNNILTGGGGNDVFVFAANGNGLDTIADFSQGDGITIDGAAFTGPITAGDGSTVLANQIQVASTGGTTTLFIGTDATAGADVQIQMTGDFQANAFAAYGNTIAFNNTPTGSVTITGTAAKGQALSVGNNLADADGLGPIAYQWQADGVNIAGATNATCLLTQAEVGKVISVVASYTDGHGTLETVTSSSTASVYVPATSRYTMLGSGANFMDFYIPFGDISLDGQNLVFKGNSGVDTVYVGSAAGLVFDFTQAGLGTDQIYLGGNWADYSRNYSGSVVTLSRTTGSTETIKAISGDNLIFADGTVSVLSALNFLKGTAAEPIPAGATSGAFPMATATPLNNTVRTVVQDATGETIALTRPGVAMIVKGGSGVDIVYVTAGASIDGTQLGLGQDKLYLTGNWVDYSGAYAGSVVTLARTVGTDTEIAKFLGGSASAYDSIVFADGTASSIDILNFLKGAIAAPALNTTEVTPLGTGDVLTGTAGADILNGTATGDTIYGNGGADTINGGAGNDTIVISDSGTTAASSATVLLTSAANGTETVIGFSAAALVNGGDVLDFSAIASLADSVATGQTLTTDFVANNVFIFDGAPIAIADAASAIANDVSVVATEGYIVIADAANGNAVTVYHSTDLAADGAETALAILSGVNITSLAAENLLV